MFKNVYSKNKSVNYGRNLAATKRCKIFETIAINVWNRIIRSHLVGVDLNEIGVTDSILTDLLIYHGTHVPNSGLYAQNGWKEQINGSDIDVFVEVQPNKYLWFALQAKILKIANIYPTQSLRHPNKSGVIQWDMLLNLQSISGCIPYYLLYNGLNLVKSSTNHDQCNRSFQISQFGCSLVKPDIVKSIGSRNNAHGFISPKFEDFHPQHAQPWRILTCCRHDFGNLTVYSLSDVLGAKRDYDVLIPAKQPIDFQVNASQDNRIRSASLRAGWDAAIMLISQLSKSIK